MKLTVSKPTRQDFVNALTGRDRAFAFTEAGASALYDYYSDLSDQTGEEFYIDCDAIREQWVEMPIGDDVELIVNSGDHPVPVEEWLSANHEHYIRIQSGSYEAQTFDCYRTGFVFTCN